MNTLVWGFNGKLQDVINSLEDKGVINICKWFIDKDMLSDNQLDLCAFTALNTWVDKYKDLIEEYTSDVKFNADVYNSVYMDLMSYVNFESRYERFGNKPLYFYINKFNLLFRFMYSMLVKEKIELILFSNLTHLGADYIMYKIAKKLNIRTLLFMNSYLPNHYGKSFYIEDIEDFGDFKSMSKIYDKNEYDIIRVKPEDLFYMKKSHASFKELCHQFPLYRKYKEYRKYTKKLNAIIKPVDYTKKYVYFPLHLQPELTTSLFGGKFCDQLLALEILSEMVPSDWVIYVKENPLQKEFNRDDMFFNRLSLLKNVQLVPREESSYKLTKNAQILAIISGTAGWEALTEGVPALVFGQAWYQNFEGAFKWTPDLKIEDVIGYKVDQDKLKQNYNDLLSRMPNAVVNRDYIKAVPDYNEEESFKALETCIKDMVLEEVAC